MSVRLLILCLFLSELPMLAQHLQFDFGAKAGVPITRAVVPLSPGFPGVITTTRAWGPRLSGGPSVTLLVDDRLVVDVDVIFRPVRYETRTEEP